MSTIYVDSSVNVNYVRNLISRLVEAGVSKSEIARLLGVDRSTIYKWLKGDRTPTTVELWRLEKLFDLFEDRLVDSYFSRNHGGPPSNFFSFKVTQIPEEIIKSFDGKPVSKRELRRRLTNVKSALSKCESRVLRESLAKLTWFAGIFNITYKVLIDDAALIIREHLKTHKVKRKETGELALAALRIASARIAYKIDTQKISLMIREELIDEETYKKYLAELARTFL